MIHNKSETLNKKKCNCINKSTRPLSRECQSKNVIYQASLNSDKLNYGEKYYKCSCEITFKKRFVNHKKNHLTTSNVKTKKNFQRKNGTLSQQITTNKLPKDVPLEIVQY